MRDIRKMFIFKPSPLVLTSLVWFRLWKIKWKFKLIKLIGSNFTFA